MECSLFLAGAATLAASFSAGLRAAAGVSIVMRPLLPVLSVLLHDLCLYTLVGPHAWHTPRINELAT